MQMNSLIPTTPWNKYHRLPFTDKETDENVHCMRPGLLLLVTSPFPQDQDSGGPWMQGSNWRQCESKAQSSVTGHSILRRPSLRAPSLWHLWHISDPQGSPSFACSSSPRASALSWLCLLHEGKSQISLELPAACQQHHLSIPYSSDSTSQTCHFLTKPKSAPSPEFFLSNGGSTIPPTTQPENCENQPWPFLSPQQYRIMFKHTGSKENNSIHKSKKNKILRNKFNKRSVRHRPKLQNIVERD